MHQASQCSVMALYAADGVFVSSELFREHQLLHGDLWVPFSMCKTSAEDLLISHSQSHTNRPNIFSSLFYSSLICCCWNCNFSAIRWDFCWMLWDTQCNVYETINFVSVTTTYQISGNHYSGELSSASVHDIQSFSLHTLWHKCCRFRRSKTAHSAWGQPGIYRLPGSCRPVQAVYPMQYGILTSVLSGLTFPSLTIL